MMPLDPPPQILEEIGFSIDIDAFMNQLGHGIINQNKETIMENFLRDNVGAFDFGHPPRTDILDPMHPLFGW